MEQAQRTSDVGNSLQGSGVYCIVGGMWLPGTIGYHLLLVLNFDEHVRM